QIRGEYPKGGKAASPEFGGKLGSDYAVDAVETVQTDVPVFLQEEADAIAEAILRERQMQYITGEVLTGGNPELKARQKVNIKVNDPKFDGPYYVVRARHRYVHDVAGLGGVAHREAGYRTLLRVKKDAEGQANSPRLEAAPKVDAQKSDAPKVEPQKSD